ncbi:MAG: hypothetical protein QXO57_03455 [Candidatus Aenigmatarchaeota archaeon]
MSEYQENLDRLTKELFSRKMSRRDFLALTTAQAASLATGAFLAGGLVGYLLGKIQPTQPTVTSIITKTITEQAAETKTLTLSKTLTHTTTTTQTLTRTIASPTINVSIGYSYLPNLKSYQHSLKLDIREPDDLEGLEAKVVHTLTNREYNFFLKKNNSKLDFISNALGDYHVVINALSKDGLSAKKEFSYTFGLNNEEIEHFGQDNINYLWRPYISDENIPLTYKDKDFRIFSLRESYNALKDYKPSLTLESGLFLKELSVYRIKKEKDLKEFISVLPLLINTINSHPYMFKGLSNKYPIKEIDAEALAFIALDNSKGFEKYPYFSWALAKQAGSFCSYYNIGLEEIVETSDRALGRKERINLRKLSKMLFDNLEKANESGKLFVGLDKDDILKYLQGDSNKALKADNWMREKAFSPAIISADLIHRRTTLDFYLYDVYNERFPSNWYGVWQNVINKPSVRLEFALINLENFQKLNNEAYSFFVKDKRIKNLNVDDIILNKFLTSAEWDMLLRNLFVNGSELSRVGMRAMAFTVNPPYYFNAPEYWNSQYDEFRVEYGRSYTFMIGVPAYRIDVAFEKGPADGQMGFVVPTEDLKLIGNLLHDNKYTNAVHNFVQTNPFTFNAKAAYISLPDTWDGNSLGTQFA